MELLVLLLVSVSVVRARAESAVHASYVAAVYEHNVVLNPDPSVTLSREEALQHMRKNLDIYEQQAARAAQQSTNCREIGRPDDELKGSKRIRPAIGLATDNGHAAISVHKHSGAQILVFPEDGIHGFNFTRSSIAGYLETTPDPQQENWNPCKEPGRHNNTEVLQRLSCVAKRYGLYLVANMADMQPCSMTTNHVCPPDGQWQFNTNVVFSSDGLLVARYHKNNLFFEREFDKPPQAEVITFDTPFAGRFGLIICFDILFHDPTVILLERGVRQVIFPTAWMNLLPLLDSIQFQRAFSLGANVTLLAANIRNDRLRMTGSGIYTPFSAVYHHASDGDPEEGKLLVARVPVLDPEWVGQSTITEPDYCHQHTCGDPAPAADPSLNATFISSMMCDPFKFVLLEQTEGTLSVCDGTFCCRLQYRLLPPGGSTELYALGAFAGTHTVDGRYSLQVCALVRCAGQETSSCGREVKEAQSKMDFVLEGWFQSTHVYPSVLGSRSVLEQPEHVERSGDGRVSMKLSNMTHGLITACLYGRMYHLDLQ